MNTNGVNSNSSQEPNADTEAAAKVVRVDVWLRSVSYIDLNRGEQESRLALLHVCRQQARCLRVLAGGVGTPPGLEQCTGGGALLRSERAAYRQGMMVPLPPAC